MNDQLIAAILKLASAQEAQALAQANIATQIGRIADQMTPDPEDMPPYPGSGVTYLAKAIDGAVPDTFAALERIAEAIEGRSSAD